jgi:cell division protein FtsA
MFDEGNIIAGLEIGTSKICVVVGEQTADGGLNIIGLGQSKSRGVRKGEIINPEQVEEDLRAAMFEAEQMADVEIRSVYLGVSGGHLRGFNNRGMHPVVSADREISAEDVDDVVKNAKAINLPAENTVIHAVRQHFYVDGQDDVTNPVGMLGARLEVDMHVIHGHANRLQNAIRLVRATSLEVEEIVFTGIGSALALLTGDQKELGALVVDIGGGTTEYLVYSDGVIRHSGVLAVGGDHVSNDLAYGLKVPLSRAEKLKIEHGSALITDVAKGQAISITNELGLELKRVNLEHLQRIMSLRIEEIFRLIAQDLEQVGLTDYLRSGIFLCGGTSRTPGIVSLAETVFQMNVAAGHASAISGLTTALDQPEFAAAIGLVKYGSLKNRKRAAGKSIIPRGIKDVFGKLKLLPRA